MGGSDGAPAGARDGAGAKPRAEDGESRFRETFDRAPIGLAHVGLDGRWLLFNRRLAEIVGYDVAELERLRFQDITHPPDLPEDLSHVARLVAGELDSYRMEKRYVRKDGSLVWVRLHVSLVRAGDGAPRYFIVAVEDISLRRAAEDALERARAAAEAGSRAKSQFLSTMSHEIRTPLTAILGYVDLLELGVAGPLTDAQRDYLERVRRSGRHLVAIVNQVLDLARIEADRLPVRRVDAHLADAVDDALASVEPQAASRAITIVNACGRSSAGWYTGDPDRLQQIVVNLLSNAVKFTVPGGQVTVSCGSARRPPPGVVPSGDATDLVYLRVEDTGIGIPADRLAAVFDPFEQAEGGPTRPHEGTGLGLTISRRLARLMGGDLTVRSEPGTGSAFFVWLPAARSGAAAPGVVERRTRARYAEGLGAVGELALERLEDVLSAYVSRLRTDPATPSARRCTDEQLEDHAVTFLADVAQCLALVESARGAPSDLIRDGTAIQRLIGERHGAQRARLGFREAEVRREFALLAEALTAAVRGAARPEHAAGLEHALELMGRFVEHGGAAALRAFRQSGGAG